MGVGGGIQSGQKQPLQRRMLQAVEEVKQRLEAGKLWTLDDL